MTGPTFEPGPVGGTPPFSFDYHVKPPNDPTAILDGLDQSLAKLTAVGQRRRDLFNQTPTAQEVKEIQDDVTTYRNRLAFLTRSRGEGGPGLDGNAPQVRDERRKLERVEKELARVSEIKASRGARAQVHGQLDRSSTSWLVDGRIVKNGSIILRPSLIAMICKATERPRT